ncbi:hypothetical protein G6F66_014868 [Rhizopus arrhizus]|nr:hypothetical protein G6F66_014868 [Rhizopus arrhizus]
MFAVLIALGVGTLGYHAVFGAFLPVPSPARLPPGAHIGPVSLALVAGAFVFGVGMRVSGSCISAHFYRLGEGALASPFALLGAGGAGGVAAAAPGLWRHAAAAGRAAGGAWLGRAPSRRGAATCG